MTWDYIIVGAGSAGCALAYELAKSRADPTILVIEAGGTDGSPFIKVPAGQIRAIASNAWAFESEPDPTRNGRKELWQRGRVLGGSSSINGMMYVRGAAADFDRWAHQLNDASWSAQRVLPLYRDLETSDQHGELRGHHGPLHVRTVKHPHMITRAFVDSARTAGLPFNPDYNGESQEGVSYAQLNQRGGFRCSAADAFLKPLVRRKRVQLLLNAEVLKVEMVRGRASGVTVSHAGSTRTETAARVILCGGAINTPKLLMLSGIGDSQHLESLGISTTQHLPGVGRNLRDHPLLRMSYETTVPTYSLTEGFLQKLGIATRFALGREGPLANIFEAGAFLKSAPSVAQPDMQLHFLAIGYSTAPNGTLQLATQPSVTVLLNKSYPTSSGTILLRSADPLQAPLLNPRLLAEESDIRTLLEGVRVVRDIMATAPMSHYVKTELLPGPGVDVRQHLLANVGIAYHPIGTCQMGTAPEAVVGSDLRVHGVENLWVADASVMPDLISGNTNAVCMMIGAKLGRELAAS